MAAEGQRGRRLVIEDLFKSYGNVRAIDGVSLAVPPGALLTLLGPSGCGKTTLMRSISGFVTPDSGSITVDGQDLLALPPERRSAAMLFQNYSLFPHMTVAGNVGFGLRMRRVPRREAERRVAETLRLTRIAELAERYPAQLSGGQQQRVALARAVVTQPDILLLDEPFGALDQSLREHMQIELRKLQQSLGTTTLVVTHDQLEALTLSDLIAVMNEGRIEQLGAPTEIYDRPATAFVARFMGVENLLRARVAGRDGETLRLSIGNLGVTGVASPQGQPATDVTLAVRADGVLIDEPGRPGTIEARIAFASNRGAAALYELVVEGGDGALTLQAAEQRRGLDLRAPGTLVGIALAGRACTIVRD
ncbi:MAG: ABC transporter ATP-binding protein [Reyranellaceae bacterium]